MDIALNKTKSRGTWKKTGLQPQLATYQLLSAIEALITNTMSYGKYRKGKRNHVYTQ